MSLRVEWFGTPFSTIEVVRGGTFVGAEAVDTGNAALVLSGDEAAVYEAPPADLRRRLQAALDQLDALYPPA